MPVERAEELLRAGRLREGLRELERSRKALYDAGDVTGLQALAERAEATPDRRFAALAYAARQNAAHLERLDVLGERRPVMTARRFVLLAVVTVVGLVLYGLMWHVRGF